MKQLGRMDWKGRNPEYIFHRHGRKEADFAGSEVIKVNTDARRTSFFNRLSEQSLKYQYLFEIPWFFNINIASHKNPIS